MGRILLAALAMLVMPNDSQACDNQMNVSVRQVGPPIKVVEKKRAAEFILFRGDMRMQQEVASLAQREQQQEHTPLMASAPEPAAEMAPAPAPVQVVAAKKAEPKKAVVKKEIAKKETPKKTNIAKNASSTKEIKSSKNLAKKDIAKKDAVKKAKRAVAAATKPRKHRIQRSPASIGPAIAIANQ